MESKGLARPLPGGLPDALRPLLLLVQPLVQPEELLAPLDHLPVEPGDLLALRLDRVLLVPHSFRDHPNPALLPQRPPDGVLAGLRRRDRVAQRPDHADLAWLNASFR